MKRILVVALIAMSFISCSDNSTEQASTPPNTFTSEDSQVVVDEVTSLTNRLWKEGYPSKDTVLVDDLYHPKFNLVDDEGSVFTKDAELSYVRDYGDQYENFTFTIDKVHNYGNGSAVVSASCKFSGTDVGGQVFITEYYQSLTFSRFPEGWKIIYSQVSGVKETIVESAPEG